jgi:hypothetical protein
MRPMQGLEHIQRSPFNELLPLAAGWQRVFSRLRRLRSDKENQASLGRPIPGKLVPTPMDNTGARR